MIRTLYVILLVAMSLSCRSEADHTKVDKSTDGTWLAATAELGGEQLPDEVLKTIKLIIDGENYVVAMGEKVDRGTVKLDPSTTPKSIDITGIDGPNGGKTFFAIYERTGDTLRVCYDLSGNARPTEFKTTKGSQLFLVTYDREKP